MSYNEVDYNESLYNADISAWSQPLSDSTTLSEAVAKSLAKPLSDSVTPSEASAHNDDKPLLDNFFLQENLTKQVTNKGLGDTIKLTEWFTIKRGPNTNNPWGD